MSVLDRQPPLPRSTPLTGYAALAREIRQAGLMRRRPGFYSGMLAVNLTVLGGVVTAMVFLQNSWWLIAMALALAVVSTQLAFFAHDAGHRQITRKAGHSAVLGLIHANLLNGFSYGWWIGKHNAHHAHPNDLAADPD